MSVLWLIPMLILGFVAMGYLMSWADVTIDQMVSDALDGFDDDE